MKKVILYGAAALMLTATACSNDETVEVPQGAAIGFKTMIDKNAGRAATELKTANLTNFAVYGWAGSQLTFDNVAVSLNGGAWSYSPIQYWEDANYSFVAIASDKNDACTATFDPAATAGQGTVTFANSGSEDLVYAVANRDFATTQNSAVVDLVFKHALSRVRFTFVNGVGENYTIAISDLSITNAATNGTLAIPAATWTSGDNVAPIVYTIANTAVANSANVKSDYQYIIPGAAEQNVTFKVALTHPSGTVETFTHNVKIQPAAVFANGSSYNFTATLDGSNVNPDKELKPILFDATVEDWIEDIDATVTVK